MKGCARGGNIALKRIKSTINLKLIEERPNDQFKKDTQFLKIYKMAASRGL